MLFIECIVYLGGSREVSEVGGVIVRFMLFF